MTYTHQRLSLWLALRCGSVVVHDAVVIVVFIVVVVATVAVNVVMVGQ